MSLTLYQTEGGERTNREAHWFINSSYNHGRTLNQEQYLGGVLVYISMLIYKPSCINAPHVTIEIDCVHKGKQQ